MDLKIFDDNSQLSVAAADEIAAIMQTSEVKLFCPASGSTPVGLYNRLAELNNQNKIDTEHWKFVSLDEWGGMNENDEGSCRQSLDQTLFRPLKVSENRICFFDGRSHDLEHECRRIESFIESNGGIEVMTLGLGMNGHVALNEPGVSPDLHSHVTAIDEVTQLVGQKYFSEKKELKKGITLGIQNILKARHVFLIVSGLAKASIVKQVIDSQPTNQLPATLIKKHHSFKLYLDKDAAQHLNMI
jgi:glucosamine-6-phosphate isomerase